MARIRTNNVFGSVEDDPLAAGATTLNSAGLAALDAVSGGDHAIITLDPDREHGAPEIVYVTAHTGSATDATIERGQEGTAAREHPEGTKWSHAASALDLDALWRPAAARVTRNAAQSIPNNTVTAVQFNAQVYASSGMHSTSTNPERLIATRDGLYVFRAHVRFAAAGDFTRLLLDIVANGVGAARYDNVNPGTGSAVRSLEAVTDPVFLSAGQFAVANVFQTNGASAARNLAQDSLSPFFSGYWIGEL